ncbi:MAG: precorrin-3B synthase [Thiohalorhabdus sp.]|uniref:precorrin-3B synthase n=1 Tax=Thiohalorhabdus sp. TaxID=3094134 RepID=UPI003980AA68
MTQGREHGPRVREACPGVVAPMATGDGLLLRLRHPIGGLDPEQARTIARVARRYGSGALELTNRANLQLRGFTAETLPAAQEELARTGLTDADPDREAVRNVVASPVADVDPEAVADVRPLARALAEAITASPALRELPPKVGVVVDGGGRAPLGDLPADVRLEAVATAAGLRYRLAVGGTARSAAVLGRVTVEGAVPAAVAVLERFRALRQTAAEPPRRLAEAVDRFGTEPFEGMAGLEPVSGAEPVARRPAAAPGDFLGRAPQGAWVGAAFPFGALSADQLEGLAGLVEAGSGGTLRVTPWRTVLVIGAGPDALPALEALGAISDPADPRLRVSACIGAPGCDAAAAATRTDAPTLADAAADLLERGGRLHVSGCEKGCGEPAAAAAVLTAAADGYTLNVADGSAEPLQTGLAPEAAWRWLAALGRVVASEQRQGERVETTMERLGKSTLAARVRWEVGHGG